MSLNAIILAGGKATRMGELCKTTPKLLIKLCNGETILESQIKMLKKVGVTKCVLAVGHLKDVIKEQIGNKCLDVVIEYSEEETPLGTGGAFKQAFKYIDKNDYCIGLNGDIYIPDINLNGMFGIYTPYSNIIITTIKYIPPYGFVNGLNNDVGFGDVVSFSEKKPVMINAGIYLFKPKTLYTESAYELFPDVGSIEKDVLENKAKCSYYLHDGIWFDVGTPESLNSVNKYLLKE